MIHDPLLPFALLTSVARSAQAPAAGGPGRPDGRRTYYFLLGRYLEGGGKIDEAIAALRKAIALDPTSAEPRAELAGLYARQDKAAEALTAAEDALKVDPKNREANRILGSVLAALAEQRQAAAAGRRRGGVREAGDGRARDRARRTAPAICRSISRWPASISTPIVPPTPSRSSGASSSNSRSTRKGRVLLADAQEAAGAPDAAVETLTKLLDDQPQFFRGRVQLAELYEHQRRWPQAADAWAKVQGLNPRNTEVATRRAAALLSAGQAGRRARRAHRRAEDRADRSPDVVHAGAGAARRRRPRRGGSDGAGAADGASRRRARGLPARRRSWRPAGATRTSSIS